MEHSARLSNQRIIAFSFIYLTIIIIGSITTNVIQAINNYRLQNEQKSIVTPMNFRAPFAISQNQGDASYLQQWALSLIALRVNVTPETVDAAHEQLLMFARPAAQNALKIKLAEDAKRIKDNNVNSAFYMTSIKVYPASNRVDVRGQLKTWIGDSKPYPELKQYILKFEPDAGISWLSNFGEISDGKK